MSEPLTNEVFTARPDPRFKLHTSQLAARAGIKVIGAELPQILSADLILEIPKAIQDHLQNTLFEFLQGFS